MTSSSDIEICLLNAVVQEWQSLPVISRPWGVWIRKCSELMPGKDQINASLMPQFVWFLDEQGIHPWNIWAWQRFYTVHFMQPWCSKFFSMEPVPVYGLGQIGMAAFTPFAGTDHYYLETRWDGRWGHGWKVSPNATGEGVTFEELWIA